MIATIEQRITTRATKEQEKAEAVAYEKIREIIQEAFPSNRGLSGWQIAKFIRPFLQAESKDKTEEEKTALAKISLMSVATRENAHRDELEGTLQSLAWALENAGVGE